MKNNSTDDLQALQANLSLLASDFDGLKAYLAGYTDEGIYSECIEGIREQMTSFSSILSSQKIPVPILGKIFDCYYLMESLARYPSATNNAEAFKTSEHWQKVKRLAKEAAEELEGIG